MKKYFKSYILITALLVAGCQQEIAELAPPAEPTGEPGSADFTMFVSVGNSLTAGFQAGALFTEGQNNSYPSIMAKQFAIVSENDEFNQPDINSVNGYNSTYSNPAGGIIRGRLVLFDADGPAGPKTPAPAPAGAAGVPAPYNTADLPTPYAGDKTKLNNFGVPGILLAQCLTPLTGGPSTGNPAYNALYARFATNPGTSTILGDAIAKSPTFFSFWLGNNDVLGYATTGGSGAIALTDPTAFEGYYTAAITQLLGVNANTKGVVATIPYVTAIPFFTTVKYNNIPALDATTATLVNGGFAGYNTVLDGLKNPAFGGTFGTAAQLDARKVTFSTTTSNTILIQDKTLVDLGPGFDALLAAEQITSEQRTQLEPFRKVRKTTADDIITLSAGAVLGTSVGGDPLLVNGVSVPLADQYVLLPSESLAIKERVDAFNTIIKNIVNANPSRLALADINVKFNDVVNLVTRQVDGIPVNATFAPPGGLFSEDGVHPNNRGSAYIAKVFIEAINAKFGASVPLPNIATYRSTGLPVNTTIVAP